jgi:hypothetical protein
MKLTPEQLQVLQDTLKERITYKETYEEVYDHVLTALEQVDANIPLGQAINTIMLNDFGGFKGLKKIERKRRWMVARQIVKNQLAYFIDNFKFPLLPLTAIIYAFVYYFVVELKFVPLAWVILVVAALIGGIFRGVYYFKTGYYANTTKSSIKDFPFKIISYFPYYILFLCNIAFSNRHHFYSWFNLSPLVLTFIFTAYIIYTISFFRLSRDEFKKLNTKLI